MAFCYICIYGLIKITAYSVLLYMHIRDFYKKLNRICIYSNAPYTVQKDFSYMHI